MAQAKPNKTARAHPLRPNGEHANMETEQALRTTITVELGHTDREPIRSMFGQTYGKAPVVTVECVHEGIADDDEHGSLWHDDALTAATQAARTILEGVGLAEPAPQARGDLYVVVKGDTSGVVSELRKAQAAVEQMRPREGRVMRADETPDEYVQHDTSLHVKGSADHPRYIDAELEAIAVEVGCAMFGEAYRDWLDSDDQYGVASRERGAGALRSSDLWPAWHEAKS